MPCPAASSSALRWRALWRPQPAILLLDEPFSGLDARLREQIRDDTLHVLKRSRTATLMVTHDPEEAMFMADRIYLMQAGRVVQSGSPDAIYHRPVSPFVARFFTATNDLAGIVQSGVGRQSRSGALPAPWPCGRRAGANPDPAGEHSCRHRRRRRFERPDRDSDG